MTEPWNITTDDSRSENKLETFIIFCEDQNDEPIYFRSFQDGKKVKVNCIPNQKQGKLNILNTLKHCCDDGILDYSDSGYKIKDGINKEIWCVYDRDLENTDFSKILETDNLDFTTSIHNAVNTGINVAWSNDSFELWVLLHFEEVICNGKIHREYIYERLTEIFSTFPDIQEAFTSSIASGKFYYKTSLKKKEAFIRFVLPKLRERTDIAISNAEALVLNFKSTTPYHDWNPCTMVHNLILRIKLAYS